MNNTLELVTRFLEAEYDSTADFSYDNEPAMVYEFEIALRVQGTLYIYDHWIRLMVENYNSNCERVSTQNYEIDSFKDLRLAIKTAKK